MKGFCITFYAHEFQKHHGNLMYEWLLEFAKKNGIHGGSAYRGIAGFGRHGKLHEEHFFELASNVPVAIEFILSEQEKDLLIDRVKKEGVDLFYKVFPVDYERLLTEG